MRRRLTSTAVLSLGALIVLTSRAVARDLTFEDRVKAQEAIERVYYSHQIGTTQTFEEAVSRSVIERKVRLYLRQSRALEMFWNTPVTSNMLYRELQRMAEGTRMPDRLHELYGALNNDTLLIQECLARPALVGRLSRNFFAFDAAMHGAERKAAERLRAGLQMGRLNPRSADRRRTITDVVLSRTDVQGRPGSRIERDRIGVVPAILPLSALEFADFGTRLPGRVGTPGPVEEDRDAFVVRVVLNRTQDRIRVAAFAVPKLTFDQWLSEVGPRLDTASTAPSSFANAPLPPPERDAAGAARPSPCFVEDKWENGSLDDVPDGRSGHSSVWTGSHLIVWGGYDNFASFNSGGRYDPATDTWTPTSMNGSPSHRGSHTAVWTGNMMVVWGGESGGSGSWVNDGGRYDPVNDTWSPTSTAGAPAARFAHNAVWTGSAMLVWGGAGNLLFNDGGSYDPITDTWKNISNIGAP